jgi:hypothetical protein
MAALLTTANIPAEAKVGTPMSIAGTGFLVTHAITITISHNGIANATWTTTSDGSGNWAFPGSYVPQREGIYVISATDGTSTITARQLIQQG